MNRVTVLIPDGENEHALWVARSLAHSKRVKLYIMSNKVWTPVRFSRHRQSYRYRPTNGSHESIMANLTEFTNRTQVDILLPVSEEGTLFAAVEREALSNLADLPPLPQPDTLRVARNKWLLNQLARQQELPVPDALLVTFDSCFDQEISRLEYPVLLKPTNLNDGQGIRSFYQADELRKFLQAQIEADLKEKYLVQSWIPGSDLGMSVLCQDGELLAYTIQRGIISASHRFGPLMAMEFIEDDEILEIGRRLLAKLNWSGVAHLDFRRDRRDGQAKILEINARYWGSLLGSLIAGVNFPYLACLAAQRIPFPVPKFRCSKFVHTTTAIKQGLLSVVRKNSLKNITYRETGVSFFLADPIPEIVKQFEKRRIS